jgi:hypothetical protein
VASSSSQASRRASRPPPLGGLTWKATTRSPRLPALADVAPAGRLDESSRAAALEAVVDIHTFDPAALEALARGAVRPTSRGHRGVHRPMLGWPVRTFSRRPPGRLGMGGRVRLQGWLRLSWLDAHVLAHVVRGGSTTRSSRGRGHRRPRSLQDRRRDAGGEDGTARACGEPTAPRERASEPTAPRGQIVARRPLGRGGQRPLEPLWHRLLAWRGIPLVATGQAVSR